MKRDHDLMVGEGSDSDIKDESDEPDDTDDADRVPPYDARKEELPQSPVYTPEYEKLLELIAIPIALLRDLLVNSQYHDSIIDGLIEELEAFVKCSSPEEIKAALIGDMKVGKSTLVNSLLNIAIARQGDAGTSCTWVVTEYSKLFPNQEHSFAAQVSFFSQEERYHIIASLVQSFYRASSKDLDRADGPKDSELSSEDYGVQRTTVTVFRALFNDQKEFSSDEFARKFLESATAEDDQYILSRLYGWSDTLMAKTLGKDTCVRKGNNTVQGLNWDLAPFLSTVEEREGVPVISVWPFVSHIKYGLDCPLLNNNITLVDLPGLSDANKVRVKNAVDHLLDCTHYMVIAEIGRAADDKFIRDHLLQGFKTRGSGRSTLVLTHADTMDDATEVQASRKERQVLDRLAREIRGLEKQRMQASSKVKNSKKFDKYKYMETMYKASAERDAKEAQHLEQRIGIRSRNIAAVTRQMYKELTQDTLPLPVFCVGNQAYAKHRAGFANGAKDMPSLTVSGTNIPALRSHLFLAPTEGMVNDIKHQVNAQLPSLLNTFELYVSRTHMARKDEVEKIVLQPQHAIASYIDERFRALDKDAEEMILKPLRKEEYTWTEEARQLCQQWGKTYSTAIHLQFLKKEGVRKGKGKGAAQISWNGQLVSISSGTVTNCFQNFARSLVQYETDIKKEASTMLSDLVHNISNHPQFALMALKPFLTYVWGEKANIERTIKQLMRSLCRDIGQVAIDSMSESISNPIVQAMVPIYTSAREIKGYPGAPRDRVHRFERDVCRMGNGVLMQAHDHLQQELAQVLDKHRQEFATALATFFAKMHGNFGMLCADNEREGEGEAALREQLRIKLHEARELLETVIKPAYAACFANE